MNIIMPVYLLFVVTLSEFCKQSALCAGSWAHLFFYIPDSGNWSKLRYTGPHSAVRNVPYRRYVYIRAWLQRSTPTRPHTFVEIACADPEKFVRGVQLWQRFLSSMRGGTQIPISLAGHHRPTSETPLKWRFAGGPMMAKHWMLG